MSRRIANKQTVELSDTERSIQDTSLGKLIFTDYQNRNCSLLLKNNRLTYLSFCDNNKLGAIYIAKVKDVVKNINASFVEIENKEICFLSLQNMTTPILLNRKYDGRILQGDEIIVQIIREAHKSKQASVTTQLTFSDPYFVFNIGDTKLRFSSKLMPDKKIQIESLLIENNLITDDGKIMIPDDIYPSGFPHLLSAVVRTECKNLDNQTLIAKYQKTLRFICTFLKNAVHRSCFTCLQKSQTDLFSIVNQMISDTDYQEIITDNKDLYKELLAYKASNPDFNKPIQFYEDNQFSLKLLYGLTSKIDDALKQRIWLKSGGYLIIQPTEALTVIDVNSGKYEPSGGGVEDSSLFINKEAAEEIAIQLRLKNLSGIIIVDFINMKKEAHNKELLSYMRDLVKNDQVRTKVIDMTPLGLIEITRKKITKSLMEQFYGYNKC